VNEKLKQYTRSDKLSKMKAVKRKGHTFSQHGRSCHWFFGNCKKSYCL